MKLHIEAVNGCTETCPGCQSPKGQLKFMPPEIFAMAIDKLKPERTAIYGLGETFLHPDLSELLSIRNLMGIDSIIKTNGAYQTDVYLKAIGKVKRVMFDIDGITQETHGLSRSSQLTQVRTNALEISKFAKGTGTRTGIYMLVHSQNWREAKILYEFSRENDLDFEAVPYLPIQIGTYYPKPAHSHLTMSDESRQAFADLWIDETCLVTFYSWSVERPHVYGAMLRWDGSLSKCLGRLIPINQNITDDNIQIPEKLCGDCPINQLICSYSRQTVSVGAQAYAIPPRVKWNPEIKFYQEEHLIDCPLDPYS